MTHSHHHHDRLCRLVRRLVRPPHHRRRKVLSQHTKNFLSAIRPISLAPAACACVSSQTCGLFRPVGECLFSSFPPLLSSLAHAHPSRVPASFVPPSDCPVISHPHSPAARSLFLYLRPAILADPLPLSDHARAPHCLCQGQASASLIDTSAHLRPLLSFFELDSRSN